MIDKLIARRDSLKQELAQASELLAQKKLEADQLNGAIFRINGAIQILDETIEEMRQENSDQQRSS